MFCEFASIPTESKCFRMNVADRKYSVDFVSFLSEKNDP